MLVFISDLHFVDETAGKHNLPVDAFKIFIKDVAGSAERLINEGRKIEEIKIVFLGDIFDLLRTEMWFKYPENERPWGNNEQKIEANANTIFDAIVEKNKETFNFLKGDLKSEFDFPVKPQIVPQIIYVPGNHDKLCNKYKSLWDKVCGCFGMPVRNTRFDHYFQDVNCGVFARHGHEYDKFNYEGGVSYEYEDYMRTPMGDPFTTELIAKIPWKLMNNDYIKKNLSAEDQEKLKRNFQDIENIRPISAVLAWMLYQVKKNLRLKEVIEDTVDEVIAEFNKITFVEKWYKHHDKWYDFWDEADKIQSILFLFEKFKLFPMEKIMPLLERVKNRFAKDDLLEGAVKEYAHLDNQIRYIVYGHTHEPKQEAIRVMEENGNQKECIYINTGTWRPRYHKSKDDLGFISWKNLSYVVFYKKEEKGKDFPTFETWTGTLKTV